MLEIIRKGHIFKTKEVWFSDYPFDIGGFTHVVFCDCKNKDDKEDFCRKEFTTLVIDLTQDLEQIWKNMSKSSCRYGVNKAQKEGVEIKINQNFEDFLKINREFREMKELAESGITLDFIKNHGTLFTAEFNKEILSGQFYLEDKNNIRWLIGASKRLNVDRKKTILISHANRLIIWTAIKYAKIKGIKEFDFGGYYTGTIKNPQKEGINVFKKSFGGKLVNRYIYQKDYSKIYKILKEIYKLFFVNVSKL